MWRYVLPIWNEREKKKVSDMMVDAKRSLFEKEQQLVMLSGDDIIWVVGLRSDERYRVRENTKHILKIFEKKGYLILKYMYLCRAFKNDRSERVIHSIMLSSLLILRIVWDLF